MILAERHRHQLHRRLTWALVPLALGLGAATSPAQSRTVLPVVIGASVPFYPRIIQVAHIEGVVGLRISTDGRRASSIEVESGQPMLAQAAKENVKTWEFEQHRPTTFEARFRYKLLTSTCDAECNCGSSEKPTVLLRLPTDAEVSAEEVLVCDPAVRTKPRQHGETVNQKDGSLRLQIPVGASGKLKQ